MRNSFTPASERHLLLPAERAAFERERSGTSPPAGWVALGPGESGLWAGPGLTVARRVGNALELIEGESARALLVEHAFQVTREQRMHAYNLLPPGTPIPEAIAALAAAYPQFVAVDFSATGALFMHPPQAVLACDGKYGELDFTFWHEGERAIDLVFQYGRSRPLPAASGTGDDDDATRKASPASAADTASTQRPPSADARIAAVPPSPTCSATSAGAETRVLRIPLAMDEGWRLRRGLALIAGGALAGPLLALPLLVFDAVAWLIGSAALWVIAIPLGHAWLQRLEASSERPCLELEDHWLRVPLDGAMQHIDLRQATLERSWQGSIYVSPKSGGTRPAEARVHLRGPDVDLLLAARHLVRQPGFPEAPSKPPVAGRVLELLPADFRRLIARL